MFKNSVKFLYNMNTMNNINDNMNEISNMTEISDVKIYGRKLRIAVDVDEVLADLMGPVIRWHNITYETNNCLEEFTNFNCGKTWRCSTEETIARFEKFMRTSHFDELLPVPDAIDGVEKLVFAGHELFAITARPAFIEEKTNAWITKYFSNKFQKVYILNQYVIQGTNGPKKLDVCRSEKIDCIIEDAGETAYECAPHLPCGAILFERPWNNNFPENSRVKKVKTWPEIVDYFKILTRDEIFQTKNLQ